MKDMAVGQIKQFAASSAGAVSAEYALILAIVGAAIAAGALVLSGSISGSMHGTGAKMDQSAPA